MPCLSGSYDPAKGPLINIAVGAPGTIASFAGATQQPVIGPQPPPGAPVPNFISYPALIDTGADATCISPTVVQALGLQSRGKKPVNSATHAVPMNVYLVDLVLPFGNVGWPLPDTQVIEFVPPLGSAFQMLLGRDILCRGIFTLSFDGHYTFSV